MYKDSVGAFCPSVPGLNGLYAGLLSGTDPIPLGEPGVIGRDLVPDFAGGEEGA